MQYRRIEYRAASGWRSRLGLAAAMTLGVGIAGAFVLLSIGIAIVLLPVAAIAVGIGWWRLRRHLASMTAAMAEEPPASGSGGRVIETDYVVLGDGARPGR